MKAVSLLVCIAFLLSACMLEKTTTVTQDGFMARQKTVAAHRAVVEDQDVYYTSCRYDQLMYHKADNRYYCPPEHSFDSKSTGPIVSESMLKRYLGPVLGAAAVFGGTWVIAGGLRDSGQTVNNTTNEQFSTKFYQK